MKTQIFQIFFKLYICLLGYYLWWEFWQYWTIFRGERAQKPPKKVHFMDAESVRKALKTFNNHKCYSDKTYHDYVSTREYKPKISYSQKFSVLAWCLRIFRLHLKPPHMSCITTFRCITGKVFVQIPWKTTQSRSKMIATLTFEVL